MQQWYFFIHTIPPTPLYLRAKVRQKLERAGAVALKNSVYVLPQNEETLEDLEWLAGEIVAGGGQAYVVAGQVLSGISERDLKAAFRDARNADYAALLEDASTATPERLRRRFADIRQIDFFDAPKRKEAEKMLAKLERPRPAQIIAEEKCAERRHLGHAHGHQDRSHRLGVAGAPLPRSRCALPLRRCPDVEAQGRGDRVRHDGR